MGLAFYFLWVAAGHVYARHDYLIPSCFDKSIFFNKKRIEFDLKGPLDHPICCYIENIDTIVLDLAAQDPLAANSLVFVRLSTCNIHVNIKMSAILYILDKCVKIEFSN